MNEGDKSMNDMLIIMKRLIKNHYTLTTCLSI